MSRSQRFFRVLWRINAVLILVAAAGVSFAVISLLVSELRWGSAHQRAVDAAPDMGESETGERLYLGQVSPVPGTDVLRGELRVHRGSAGFSSGSGVYSEVRNLLFVRSGATVGRWLLSDNDHVIVEQEDVIPETEDGEDRVPIGMVALVKPSGSDDEVAEGDLLLLDPSGDRVQTVSSGVRALHAAALQDGRLVLLFERQRRYVVAVFEPKTLAKVEEHPLEVPEVK
jgi:hypothetical protein